MDTPLAITAPFAPAGATRTRSEAQRVAAGSLTLEGVYRAHFDFVYRRAARIGGHAVDPEDIAQEVFIVVGRKLHTYDGTSAVTTWLYGILINVIRSAWRRERLRRLLSARQAQERRTEAAPGGIDRVEVEQARAIAEAVLEKLSTKHREVFVLSEFEGLSCEEIAVIVGCRVETVWSRLHYARKEFASRVQKRGYGRVQ